MVQDVFGLRVANQLHHQGVRVRVPLILVRVSFLLEPLVLFSRLFKLFAFCNRWQNFVQRFLDLLNTPERQSKTLRRKFIGTLLQFQFSFFLILNFNFITAIYLINYNKISSAWKTHTLTCTWRCASALRWLPDSSTGGAFCRGLVSDVDPVQRVARAATNGGSGRSKLPLKLRRVALCSISCRSLNARFALSYV